MQKIFLILLVWLTAATACPAKELTIGTDTSRWYPFTFTEKGKSAGMHVDIVKEALKNLGYQAEFIPTPWDRCLSLTAQGSYDALVSGSYNEERAEKLLYPADAATEKKSKWRIMQVEYVLVIPSDSDYEFKGDIKTIPEPVRAPRGYSIVEDLRSKGVKVITQKTDRNLKTVSKMKTGSVITIPTNAKSLLAKLDLTGEMKIDPTPIKSKSYFMLFSRNTSKISLEEISAVWKEIARLRDDDAFMEKLQEEYE